MNGVFSDLNELFSVPKLASYLKEKSGQTVVSEKSIYSAIKTGTIKAKLVNRTFFIEKDAFLNWWESFSYTPDEKYVPPVDFAEIENSLDERVRGIFDE